MPVPADPEDVDPLLAIPPEIERQLIPDNLEQALCVLLRRRYRPGQPGVTRETETDWIIRSDRGCVAGGAIVHANEGNGLPVSIDVAIDPRYRRRGFATRLYEAVAQAGIDVESGSDASIRFGTMTRMGYAFMVGRRQKAASATSPGARDLDD
jgi:GNAT superfamily N-acetyltransferase